MNTVFVSAVWPWREQCRHEPHRPSFSYLCCHVKKAEKYYALLQQARGLLDGETDPIANQANLCALLHSHFSFWWTGFYRVEENELILGPFQGPVACTRIQRAKGVCGTAWAEARTIVVPDVHAFPGHIACSAESRSEIVIPVKDANGKVQLVLDIDSEHLNTFDETDQQYLEELCKTLGSSLIG